MDNDNIWGGFFVAMILFGYVVWLLSKVATKVFTELGLMFDALGAAGVSFLAFAWIALKAVAVVTAIAVVVYAGYRQYRLTKRTVDVLANVDERLDEWASNIEKSQQELERSVNREVLYLDRKLAAALAKPEAVPEAPIDVVTTSLVPTTEQPIGATSFVAITSLEQQDATNVASTQSNESATTPSISNPY